MQIQRIQNNNYNTNFGAKLQIQGAVKDLPQELIKEFETFTKSIGKDTDIVNIDIGKKYEYTTIWAEMAHHCAVYNYYRDHNIASYINGELAQHRITSNANGHYERDIKNLRGKIIGYLETLILKK